MMHYVIMLLAVVCFTAQFNFTKSYEKEVKQTLATTLIMVAVTNFVGTLLFLIVGGFKIQFSTISLFWAVALAAVMIPYFIIGVKVLSLGSLAIYSMFMMLGGMLVPFFYGVLFLKEELTLSKIAGTVLLSLFIVLQALWQSDEENQESTRGKKGIFFLLCLLIFFLNGMTGVVAKAHEINRQAVDEISFTITSCALTSALSLIFLLPCGKNIRLAFKENLRLRPVLIMILLGATAYTGNFLHLKAASFVPASVQFPLVSGGVIVLSALASKLIFKEKITSKEWISVAGAFVSTLLFAF